MIYKCSECGRLTEQKEPIPPSLVCMEDMGYERSCHGNYHPLPTLDLLARLVDGVQSQKHKRHVWFLDDIRRCSRSNEYRVAMGWNPVINESTYKLFSDPDLAAALIEAYEYCKEH